MKDQPDYRLVLVFDPANDLGSKEVCNGVSRFKPGQPGLFRPMPSTAATTWRCRRPRPGRRPASANDPQVAELFRELFMVVWPDSTR